MENQNEVVVEKQEGPKNKGQLDNYFQYVIQAIKDPDHLLTDEVKGKHQFGLITLVVFLGLVLLRNLVGIFQYLEAIKYFGFGDYFDYVDSTISIGVALALIILVFKNNASKIDSRYDLNFFFEKFGSLLAIPSLLILVSIPLDLLEVTIYSWFSSLAFTLLYLSVFMIAYRFVAKNNFKTAIFYVAGFYFVYQIVSLVL